MGGGSDVTIPYPYLISRGKNLVPRKGEEWLREVSVEEVLARVSKGRKKKNGPIEA